MLQGAASLATNKSLRFPMVLTGGGALMTEGSVFDRIDSKQTLTDTFL